MKKPIVLYDSLLAGTPFRGLVVRSLFGPCAYIGVPVEHCLADMESLYFDCHGGAITFRGPGYGHIRPEGWYWYGWDYQQVGDKVELPELSEDENLTELMELLRSAYDSGKVWAVAAIEQDLIDVAVQLAKLLEQVQGAADSVLNSLSKSGRIP